MPLVVDFFNELRRQPGPIKLKDETIHHKLHSLFLFQDAKNNLLPFLKNSNSILLHKASCMFLELDGQELLSL